MKTTEINGVIVKTYDNPEELPMRRYQRFNKFLMIENEVGSTFEDYKKRSEQEIAYLRNGMIQEAIQELSNRTQMVYNAFMEYSPKGRAMAILVHSIGGTIYKDYTASGLDAILDDLENIGLSQKIATEIVDETKKKIETALTKYFPSKFKETKIDTLEYNSELIKKMTLEVKEIAEGKNEAWTKAIQVHEKKMLSIFKTNSWNVNTEGNMEIQMETDFTKYMFSIEEHSNSEVEDMSVFRFYALEEYVSEKIRKQKTNGNN